MAIVFDSTILPPFRFTCPNTTQPFHRDLCPSLFFLSHFGCASRDKNEVLVTSLAGAIRRHTLIFTKLIFWVQEITRRCNVTAISETLGTYVFVQHTHTQKWRHQWCMRSRAPDSAASTACRAALGAVSGQSRTKPRFREDMGMHDAPEVAQTFFFRGHLRRLAAPKARQERSSSTRVTRCSPPYDRSVDRDDSRKKIATLSFRREIAAITPFYLFWCSAAS